MLTAATLNFLSDLAMNNNRDWFHANKPRFEQEVQKPFLVFVAGIIEGLVEIDPRFQVSAKDAVFRIYRDTRFGTDKTPYKTNISASITPLGKKSNFPGFYVQVDAEKMMIGGGAYSLEKEQLLKIREGIAQQESHFLELIKDPNFVQHYGAMKGENLKRVPVEWKEVYERIPLIVNKQFYFMAEMDSDAVLKSNAVEVAVDYAKAGLPLIDFLGDCIHS
jgi:uncharacterized protein (TIGR02453 family)